ncbi:MAG TPA: alpha-L-arabinofuranosidase C-terminal domain-containing protein [Candidatus Acidoferrales bacterium]|nr:alpha-L-arabinofuranosidase C-terminal domain-containing protein [Candidatus Acidoferrales bacterium]
MRKLCIGLLWTAAALAQAPAARIKIDTDRRVGEVDRLLFGNFAEHLGRMIYGGIYDEGSPLSDQDGFRRDVMEAVKTLGVSVLRYPGGNFASGYNWKDGIGPKDLRPTRPEGAWDDLETNRFGTDEFLKYCERIGAEPYLCINAGLGTIEEARQWVEYTNEPRHTYWADQRRKNGRDAPWNVKFWGLGNEIDGPWQLGHKNAEDYAKFALEAAKAMRSVDRSVKLIASGSSNYGADWVLWNRTVLNALRDHADYISLHTYIGNQQDDLERFLGQSQVNLDRYIDTTAALIREAQGGRPSARPIYIAYDEWNVWYRVHNEGKLEEIYNFEDALAMGMFFNTFFRHADVVKMANLAQMVNVIAPIMTNKQGLFLQPTYYPIVEYGKQRGNVSLAAWVSSPTYTMGGGGRGESASWPELPYLDVSATYDTRGRVVFVNVLNRSKGKDLTTRIECQEGTPGREIESWQMNHPDLKATHTFGKDKSVLPVTKRLTIEPERNGFTYTFPAHSLTILKLRVS